MIATPTLVRVVVVEVNTSVAVSAVAENHAPFALVFANCIATRHPDDCVIPSMLLAQTATPELLSMFPVVGSP
jgi:hypothetical protein